MTLRIAVLLDNYSAPWNEGYKNLAKYIIEMLGVHAKCTVFLNAQDISKSDFDLIYIFNPNIRSHSYFKLALSSQPIVKQIAKKELDINFKERTKAFANSKLLWDNVIVTTPQLKTELSSIIDEQKIYYLPPPIPVNYFVRQPKEQCRAELGLSSRSIYIAYAGRLNAFRKISTIFQALNEAHPANIKLVLSLTEAETGQRAIMEDIMKRSIDSSMIETVACKDVRKLYSCADLIVYPVERRGAIEPPLTLLEAMSCGTAVAAYETPVSRDLIKGNNGFLFSDSKELRTIIESLDKGLFDLQAIGQRARETIVSNFKSEDLAQRYLDCFQAIVDRRHQTFA